MRIDARREAAIDHALEAVGDRQRRRRGDAERERRRRRSARDSAARGARRCSRLPMRRCCGVSVGGGGTSGGAGHGRATSTRATAAQCNAHGDARQRDEHAAVSYICSVQRQSCCDAVCSGVRDTGGARPLRETICCTMPMRFQRSWLPGASLLADIGTDWMQNPANPLADTGFGPMIASGLDVFAHASQPRGKPEFGFESTIVDGKTRSPVIEEIVLRKPFGQLKHFAPRGRRRAAQAADRRADVGPLCDAAARHGRADAAGPRRLHHRLARRQAGAARRRPLRSRRLYRLSSSTSSSMIGPGAHVLAVCQPSVPVYAADLR